MAQYIDKNDLVKAIDRQKIGYNVDGKHTVEYDITRKILDIINALEVKEVDLDEAARKWEDKVYLEKGWQDEYGTPHAPFSEIGNAFIEGVKYILKAQKGE